MIKRIKIENFRSFVKAEAELQPFTLVIGANGAGKSNLLRWFVFASTGEDESPHILHRSEMTRFVIDYSDNKSFISDFENDMQLPASKTGLAAFSELIKSAPEIESGDILTKLPFESLPLFNLSADAISRAEPLATRPTVRSNGSGTTQVLESLKNGNREDLFDSIEKHFKLYVPEVEKLSFFTSENKKSIQVRERGLGGKTLPASELSEGTRLILCILTIIHQENPPPVILLEDIDRGMHPRLFEQIAPLMRKIAEEHDINIIATTHNPYLVDAFQDAKECVLLVEKVDGASVLVPLTKKLEGLDYDKEEAHVSLGELWYSGLVGGVPLRAKR